MQRTVHDNGRENQFTFLDAPEKHREETSYKCNARYMTMEEKINLLPLHEDNSPCADNEIPLRCDYMQSGS